MTSLVAKTLYGRGLNIAAQLSPTRKSFTNFTEIQSMAGVSIKKLGCGYLQSYYLLQDGGFIRAGYFMDSLTSIRVINLHRLAPRLIPMIQRFPILGKTLSFKGGDQVPTLFNRDIQDGFEDVVFGVSRVFGFAKKQVFAMGQNYFGQLANRKYYELGTYLSEATLLSQQLTNYRSWLWFSTYFPYHQYRVSYKDNDSLYGCGKASDYQIQPIKYAQSKKLSDKIEVPQAILKGEKVMKATGGLKFSLVWTNKNKIYAMGDNRFGQCGQNNILLPEVKTLTQILWQWEKGETIIDIACGFCHSLVLTNKSVYFFGSIQQNQNPFKTFYQNICAPTPLPITDPRRIFTGFDRSAIINKEGQAYIFGGRDLRYCGGQTDELEIIEGLNERSEIGLGFAHTLIYP